MNDLSKIFVGLGLLCSVLSAGADVKVFVTNQGSDSVTVFSFDGKFKLLREVQVGKAQVETGRTHGEATNSGSGIKSKTTTKKMLTQNRNKEKVPSR